MSLLIVDIIRSLLRNHGIVTAIIVRIRVFMEKYIIVPLKYEASVYAGNVTKQIKRNKETSRKLPEKPYIRGPI